MTAMRSMLRSPEPPRAALRNFALTVAALLAVSIASLSAAQPFLVFEPRGHSLNKNIVLISGDEEYRSEELLPQLAKILAVRHGFRCTVLFAIDPKDGTVNPDRLDNIPGLEALDSADLLVILIQAFRHVHQLISSVSRVNHLVIVPDLSVLEHNNTIRVLRDIRLVSDDDDRDAMVLIEPLKKRHHFHRGARVQVSRRLISKDQGWLVDESPGYGYALLLSA